MLIASRVMPWAEGSVLQHSAFLKTRPRPHQGVYIIVFYLFLCYKPLRMLGIYSCQISEGCIEILGLQTAAPLQPATPDFKELSDPHS